MPRGVAGPVQPYEPPKLCMVPSCGKRTMHKRLDFCPLHHRAAVEDTQGYIDQGLIDLGPWRVYLLSRSERAGTCLLWNGPFNKDGYGSCKGGFPFYELRTHRLSYRVFKGPIPGSGVERDPA